MQKQTQNKLLWIVIICLFAGSLLAVLLAGERVVAAMLDAWKFAAVDHRRGIDLGATSSLQFVFFCLVGITGCSGLRHFSRHSLTEAHSKIAFLASVFYLLGATSIVAMVSLETAHLYCGR